MMRRERERKRELTGHPLPITQVLESSIFGPTTSYFLSAYCIPGPGLRALIARTCLILTAPYEVGAAATPTLQMRKWRLREMRCLAQGHSQEMTDVGSGTGQSNSQPLLLPV